MGLILGYLILILPTVAIISFICYLPIYFIQRKKYGKRPLIRHIVIFTFIGIVCSILYVTGILWGVLYATILRGPDWVINHNYHFLNLIPFVWLSQTYEMGVQRMISQLVMNAIMLIPMGFMLPIVFKKMRKLYKTVLCVALFIVCVETVQYFIGRSADVDDLIMNTLGGMIGYAIYAVLNKILSNKSWWKNAKAIQ